MEMHYIILYVVPGKKITCRINKYVDPQVRDSAMNCLVEIYRHVGERVRMDLGKKGLPQSR